MEESNYADRLSNVGRNEPCPCGSGKKYKFCHQPADAELRHQDSLKLQEEMKAASEKADEDDTDQPVKNTHRPNYFHSGPGHKDKAKGKNMGVHRTTNK